MSILFDNAVHLYVIVLLFDVLVILKKCHHSIFLLLFLDITFVVGASQSLLEGVFTLIEELLVNSESIYYIKVKRWCICCVRHI